MLTMLVLACAPVDCDVEDGVATDSAVDTAEDTGEIELEPHADADGDGLPDSWGDPVYWEESLLEPLILPESLPDTDHWELRIATSPDGVSWVPDERIIAYGMSSLDLIVLGDWLIVTGMLDAQLYRENPGIEPFYRISALATEDLLNWGGVIWDIENGSDTYLVDPALQRGVDGVLRASWFAHSSAGADPADIEGAHDVQRGTWSTSGAWVQDDDDPEYGDEWLVDPVICELGGKQWLFYSHEHSRIRAAVADVGQETFERFEPFSWEGTTVPFCSSDGTEITLLGQAPGGLEAPRTGKFSNEGAFTEGASLYKNHPWGDNCTSPVYGKHKGQWVLACAAYVRLGL